MRTKGVGPVPKKRVAFAIISQKIGSFFKTSSSDKTTERSKVDEMESAIEAPFLDKR